MSYDSCRRFKIINVEINFLSYQKLLKLIDLCIQSKGKMLITGTNAHIVNCSIEDKLFRNSLKEFDVVHPDGIGVYLASKFLYGVNGLKERITGSDFYIELIQEGIKNSWSFYFFGDKEETLNRISVVNPQLTILGFSEGYNFITENILKNIENLKPDILIVGLGSVKQEKWITENKQSIHAKVIIAVGDGTKVFAGNKKRGPKLIQMIGFEWLIRLFFEPKRLWKRYLVGIPLFILRIIKYKLSKQQLENYD